MNVIGVIDAAMFRGLTSVCIFNFTAFSTFTIFVFVLSDVVVVVVAVIISTFIVLYYTWVFSAQISR